MSKRKDPPSVVARLGEGLADASRDFGALCDEMDQATDETAFKALVAAVAEQRSLVEDKIDRFVYFREAVLDHVERWKKRAAKLREDAAKLKLMMERIDAKLVERIDADPEKPWTGKEWRLRAQTNGQASLVITLATERGDPAVADVSVTNVIDNETSLNVDEKFLSVVSYTVLDRKAVRAALDAGETLPWARLERGRHLRKAEV